MSSPSRDHRPYADRPRARDEGDAGRRAAPRYNTDREALRLREEGSSFAAIARTIGLKRAGDAREAFLRALRARPDEERQTVVEHEVRRLDELEARIRTRDATEPDRLETRLAALATMRASLP